MILSYIFTRWLSMIYKKGIHHSQRPLWHRTLVFKVTSEWPVPFEIIVIEMAKYKCLPDIKPMSVVHIVQLAHCYTIQNHIFILTRSKVMSPQPQVDLRSRQILTSSLSESLSQAMMRSPHIYFGHGLRQYLWTHTMCCERMIKGFFALIIKSPWIFPDSQVLVS